MKHKDGKPGPQGTRVFPMTILFVLLCGFSFYLGGMFCSEKNKIEPVKVEDVTEAVQSSLQLKPVTFAECSSDYQDYTPCTDPRRWRKYGVHRLTFMERHCPPVLERKECLVPPPDGYKPPIRWPNSRDECWYRNVPYDWINKQKSNQNWLRKEGEKFLFPGGGTMFPRGVSAYVDLMQDLIPEMKDGTVRTAIDTGCGVASWGGDLLDRGILTVSLAPRDNHEAQVQFALERGIPAILGIISTQRLPFPSNSFDMAHCSRCLIPWTEFGGIYLLEVHRILRPGGFWVLSGPPVNYENRWRGWNTTVEEQKSDYEKLQDLLTSLCFKLYNKKDDIAVWQKLSDSSCYNKLSEPDTYPAKCDDSLEPDSGWYTPLRSCVVVPDPKLKKSALKSIPQWPERLHVAPERISDVHGGSASAFNHDDSKWRVRLKHYKKLLPAIGTDKIRILTSVLSKAAKPLILEILKTCSEAGDEMWLFNRGGEQPLRYNQIASMQKTVPKLVADIEFGSSIIPTSLSGRRSLVAGFNNLFLLQDIVMMTSLCSHSEYDIGKLFYSTLSSVSTISDFILRKVRGFLMVILLECTKMELLADGNEKPLSKKSKANPSAFSRKSKGKTRKVKRPNPVPRSCADDFLCEKSLKDRNCTLAHKKKADSGESKIPGLQQEVEISKEASSSKDEMEHAQTVVAKAQTAARKGRKEKGKNKITGCKNSGDVIKSERSVMEASSSSVIPEDCIPKSYPVSSDSAFKNKTGDNSASCNILVTNSISPGSANGPTKDDDATQSIQENYPVGSSASSSHTFPENYNSSNSSTEIQIKSSGSVVPSPLPAVDHMVFSHKDTDFQNKQAGKSDIKDVAPDKGMRVDDIEKEAIPFQDQERGNHLCDTGTPCSFESFQYEWPGVACAYYPPVNPHLPPATDRLHLDVGHNWQNHFRQSFLPTIHQARSSPIQGGCNPILTRPPPMSLDWPPVVRSARGLALSRTFNYDSGFISKKQCSFPQVFSTHSVKINATNVDNERKYSWDCTDLPDPATAYELADECDSHWISEDEVEVQAFAGVDYNQYFGGGVMYWNPSDHPGTVFSRPPSLSSDDSSWAWREADMNRAVDDMVAFSSSYGTNGLTSPTASFCSPFDPLGSGNQALGYVLPGSEVPGKVLHSSSTMTDTAADEESSGSLADVNGDVEGKAGDSLTYPILRPIIIPNISRERSREFKRSYDRRSPCVPTTRREQPRIKRPPSPVVLSVPQAPRPPPPSPVSDARKHRGFPTVRSGSSSPRHWGMRGWFHDGANLEETCLRMDGAEVVWPLRSNNISGRPLIQPLPAPLLQDRLIAISQLACDQEHPDVALPLQPPDLHNCPIRRASLSLMHSLVHDDIDLFCKQVAAENMARKPYINWAVKRVTRSLQVLWPRSRTNIFGSTATGLSLPTSDVDLVVCLPPVRNLEPIKEAGILEGRNGIKETCLQHAARYLVNQDWVKNDSLKTVENTAIPVIMLVVEVPHDLIVSSASNVQSPKEEPPPMSGEHGTNVNSSVVVLEESVVPKCSQINDDATKDSVSVRIDISFKSPSHTGLQTTQLVKDLTEQFPAATPLALVLKQFLADRSLDQSYSGGLSSYCLVLLITRFLQHEYHLGWPINQNFGSLLMNFLYFFGNMFDPRQMRISVQGSGVYIKRERGCSIDPIHIDDPLFPTNNVGRNCFRIHQCIKAFSEAYSILENELASLPNDGGDDVCSRPPYRLLSKIIPSIDLS